MQKPDGSAPVPQYFPPVPYTTILELLTLAVVVPEVVIWTLPQSATTVVLLQTVVPVLFSVRYGFVAGVGAALLSISVSFQFHHFSPHILPHFPKIEAAVYLLAAGITGYFHDHWRRTLREASTVAEADRLRLEQFTAQFHLLQASHADLERHLGASRCSVRAALQDLKEQLACTPTNVSHPLRGIGMALLRTIAEPCHVLACAVYETREDALLACSPVASIGTVIPLSDSAPMLREAFESASVVSVGANEISAGQIIAVVPLVDCLGRTYGVVTINQMPFFAIHQHTFELMAVIARQAANLLSSQTGLFAHLGDTKVLRASLACNLQAARFQRLHVMALTLRIVAQERPERLVAQCLEVYRGIDRPWLCHDGRGHLVLVILMPMRDAEAGRAQVKRLRDHLAEQTGSRVASDGVEASVTVLASDRDVQDALAEILRICDPYRTHGTVQADARLKESYS